MDFLGDRLEGAQILDLFSGSGALGLEALSRGAASVDFVERGGEALHALKANVAGCKLRPLRRGQRPTARFKSTRIFKRDALPFIARLDVGAYDLAFADPPYGSRKLDQVIKTWQALRFAQILCVEHAPDHPIPRAKQMLSFEASHVSIYGL